MAGRRLKLKAQSDFVARLSQSPTSSALEELIWNAFDERAKNVTISLAKNALDGIDQIEICDDGESLEFKKAAVAFENLGKSDKPTRTLESGESLHGRKGEGRHKALSLGGKVVWEFVYRRGKELMRYEIIGTAGRSDPFYLTEEQPAPQRSSVGCKVKIFEITKSHHRLLQPAARQELSVVFAPFLLRHQDRHLFFDGHPIRPKDAIQRQTKIRTFKVQHHGLIHDVDIELIHWKPGPRRNEMFLCTESGIPLHPITDRTLPASLDYSIYIRSDLFDYLHQENLLSTIQATNDGGRKKIVEKIQTKIRSYFRRLRQKEANETLNRLKDEGSYPFRHNPSSEIDKVERHVFDVCAINISRHLPNFNEGMDVNGRKLLLRMIQEALTQNPTSVGKIIREVCKLPQADAKAFADLLEDVPLSNVVHAARMVAERLNFLTFFEAIIYLDPFDRLIKERTELQRILAMNTWLFGEEYAHGTDDENLKKILEKHIEILGRDHLQPEMRESDLRALINEHNKGKKGTPVSLERVPDLMLWRSFSERRPDEFEFLVIEIKRPGVKIGRKEMAQIEDYAKAVASTPFKDVDRTEWVFVVISDGLDEDAYDRTHQDGMEPYTILNKRDARYKVRALPWSTIIRSAKARHEHLREWLDHCVTVERAMQQATEVYEQYIPPPKSLGNFVKKKAKRKSKRSGTRKRKGA